MQEQIDKIMNKKMSRKKFLALLGVTFGSIWLMPKLASAKVWLRGDNTGVKIMPFANSVNGVTVAQADGTDFVTFDTTNKRVGIGTTVPLTSSHIAGTTASHVETVEMGITLSQVVAPTGVTAVIIPGEGMNIGAYHYAATYITALGETDRGIVSVDYTTTSGNQQATVTIPVSTDSHVIGRRIYRSKADGADYNLYIHSTINENTSTTFTDSTPDSGLDIVIFGAVRNTTNRQIYVGTQPGFFVDYSLTTLGKNAGAAVTSALDNVFIGGRTGQQTTTGGGNTAIGTFALDYNTIGGANTAIGFSAMRTVGTNCNYNVAIGRGALNKSGNKSFNVAIGGYACGEGITTGGYNTLLGAYSGGKIAAVSNSIFLGAYSGAYETAGSSLYIDGLDRATIAAGKTNSIIYGVMNATVASQTLRLNANVGINITPSAYLTLPAGTATAGTAPLKFTSGTLNTTAEVGAVEYLTDDFYGTITTGAARKKFVLDDGTNLVATRVPFAGTNGRLVDDADLTFATDTLTATKLVGTTSVSSPLLISTGVSRLKGYTVAGLGGLTPVQGDTAYVTDALAPAFLTVIVGGGAIVTPVFYNGTNWISY